eukprot:m.30235 g.30235  ORF g.30235 m.30235 type:complete len:88 (-) comp6773_c0_seq1:3731-3994(-)
MVDKTTVPVPQSFLLDALPEAKAAVWSTDESASKCDSHLLNHSSLKLSRGYNAPSQRNVPAYWRVRDFIESDVRAQLMNRLCQPIFS